MAEYLNRFIFNGYTRQVAGVSFSSKSLVQALMYKRKFLDRLVKWRIKNAEP